MTNSVGKPRATPLLIAKSIAKSFGGTQALIDANVCLIPGEICGLLGANGAGKSTLSRIIAGYTTADGGEITLGGKPFIARSARDALQNGIALVAQETNLAPDLTVLENIFLPELATKGRLSFGRMRARAEELMASLGHEHALPLDREVRSLSSAQRQLVEIAKALALDARLVIFDEPTASLSVMEVNRLFDIMAQLRDSGRALGFVSHRLEEVFAITDRVTVLREGSCVVEDIETTNLTQADIIRHMVGKEIGTIFPEHKKSNYSKDDEVILQVSHLKALPWVRDMSFSVKRGEILGLGGLVGAGRTEAVEAVFGLRPRQGGEIKIKGSVRRLKNPMESIAAGIGFVAEDRRAQNIIPHMSVRENLMLAHMGRHRGFGRGFGSKSRKVEQLVKDLGLPADRLDSSLLNFSGGMQQKIIIARWLLTEPEILILDEPTKGVDIGTRASIYRMLQEAADAGLVVIVISSDFEELLGIAERIVVVSDGKTIADLPAKLLNEEKLTLLAAPRSSTERNTEVLQNLSQTYSGEAFWTLIDDDELICLAQSTHLKAPNTGLKPGQAIRAHETLIPEAIAKRGRSFTVDGGGSRATFITKMENKRGHDLGWIGLTVAGDTVLPSVDAIEAQVKNLV